jgi:UDP-glucose 4-epimerase
MTTVAANKHLLISGGAGYIGSRLTDVFGTCGWAVTRLARPGTSSMCPPDTNTTTIEADISDANVWLRTAERMDVIIHLAAQTSAHRAEEDVFADAAVNVRPMMQLLETCRLQRWNPFIVFASTATVVGLPDRLPVSEAQVDQPLTVYDLHKWMAEQYLEMYCRLGHARGTILRLANVYGPGPERGSSDRGVLNAMIRRALSGLPLTIFGRGEWLRDYIYIDDVVDAFRAAMNNRARVNGRHWIVASGAGCTLRDAAELVVARVAVRTGIRVPVQYVTPPEHLRAIDKRNFVADISGFSSATCWRPTVSLEAGIDRTIDVLVKETQNAS